MRRPLLAALVAALVLLPAPALAAPTLVAVEPENGAVVPQRPDAVSLTFSEPLAAAQVEMLRSPGDTGPRTTRVNGAVLSVVLDAAAQGNAAQDGAGAYVLEYTVTAADGGLVSGQVGFTVDPAAEAADEPPSAWGGPLALLLLAGLALALWSTLRRWGRARGDADDPGDARGRRR